MKLKRVPLIIGTTMAVLFSGHSALAHVAAVVPDQHYQFTLSQPVIKSESDHRDYRFIEMENGLKVLLISDPGTDKSAAAVSVNVGSWKDPDHRLGLAHFLEHMLFLGNKKYPEVDGYSEFIEANGGSTNAYTTETQTNFFFDVNTDQLRSSLDQLAQFFVSPTLDPAYVERERNAVDSEYKMHAKNDSWRILSAEAATSNPEHPQSRFTIGNLDTLSNDDGVSLWKDLSAFYHQYYVASNIGVVVYGHEPVTTLEQWVKESFEGVPEGAAIKKVTGQPPYKAEQLGVRINMVPLREIRQLSLDFPLPDQHKAYHKKPLRYLARILDYKGENSLHSYLKNRGLINTLAVGANGEPGEYSEFSIVIELTPEGLERVDEVTATVFDYLALIRDRGLRNSLFEEAKQIAELAFRFQEKMDPQSTVSTLSTRLHDIPVADLLRANYLYEEFDENLIRGLLLNMTADNVRQVVVARELLTNAIEPYFQTPYSVRPLSESFKKRLSNSEAHDGLDIPAPNKLIAQDLDMRTGDGFSHPKRVIEQPGLSVWHMTDDSFGSPKATVLIEVSTSTASDSAKHDVALRLYRALLSRSLDAFGYPAEEAGLSYGISSGRDGLMITLSGYQDKQGVLLEHILKSIKGFNPDPKAFAQEKEALITRILNNRFKIPFEKGINALRYMLRPRHFTDKALVAAAEATTFEDIVHYAEDFYRAIHIDMLVHGNLSNEEALGIVSLVQNNLLNGDNAAERFHEPFNQIGDQNRTCQVSYDHNDSVYISYFQRPDTSYKNRVTFALLGNLLATPFFKQLRTEEQLGYVVFARSWSQEKHPGLLFVVQSPVMEADALRQRVEYFLQEQQERINSLTVEELESHRRGMLGDLLKKDSNLDERSARFWGAISHREVGFDYHQKMAEELKTLTVKDIQEAMAQMLSDKGRLSILSKGQYNQTAQSQPAEG